MSRKKVIILSKMDYRIIDIIKNNRCDFHAKLLGKIKSRAFSDIDFTTGLQIEYLIRRIDIDDYVYLEQYIATVDENTDDYIIERKIKKNKIPKTWCIKKVVC